jgi:hypothetical protein
MKTYSFTKTELIEAFRKWNYDYLTNPEQFEDITEDSAEGQANDLLDYLVKE